MGKVYKPIVLISGKQGSGKSTLAEGIYRAAFLSGWMPHKVKFAEVIYALHDACLPILKLYGIRPEEMHKDGELLQVLGTEYGRKLLGENVWAKATRKYVERNLGQRQLFIIDDARFENEFDAFPDALTIRLNAPADIRKERCSYWRTDEKHASEIGLDAYAKAGKFDITLQTTFKSSLDVQNFVLNALAEKLRDPTFLRTIESAQ